MTTTVSPIRIAGVDVPTGLYINGTWQEGATAQRFPVLDPSTGAEIATIADATTDDATRALDAAHAAQVSWGQSTPRERSEILRTAFELIRARREDVAAVITAEMGRPLAESVAEVNYAAEFFRWFSEGAARLRGDFGPSPDGSFDILTTKVPVGPSLLITPWNFPLAMGTRKIGAALAAGCTVVMKPAAQTPLTAAILVSILEEAGVPAGVINLVPTSRAADQSRTLMADARLRKVSFTGSTGVGVQLLHQAADNVMRSSMELGGNGPFLVLDDADLDAAVDGAMLAKFRNAGQSCVAANRFIVQAAVAEEFARRLAERTAQLRIGDGTDPDSEVGPVIDHRQLERVERLVADAVADGARVLTGGRRADRPGYFYEPTVLIDVPASAAIASEEIFGPVAVINVVDTEEEAVIAANDTEFGLAAFVFTENVTRAFDVARRIEAGMVGINRGLVSEATAPFGGMKASGLGREGGELGIEEFVETKYLALGRVARG